MMPTGWPDDGAGVATAGTVAAAARSLARSSGSVVASSPVRPPEGAWDRSVEISAASWSWLRLVCRPVPQSWKPTNPRMKRPATTMERPNQPRTRESIRSR
jgi:hypothetical protein